MFLDGSKARKKLAWGESKMQIASRSLIEPGLFWAALKGLPEGAAWMKWENPKEMGLSENILVEVAIECGK